MPRDYLSRAARSRPVLLKPKPDRWKQRQRWLATGTALTLIPGLLVLPVAGFLVISPRFPQARLIGVILVAAFVACEIFGIPRLVRCLYKEFDLISALAFGALVVLLVILVYTGILLVSFFFSAGSLKSVW